MAKQEIFDIFRQTDYKAVLKQKQRERVKLKPQLTWKFIAEKIRVQHTYISRSFHHEDVHLNEDHLFEVLELLNLDAQEKEFVLLLRAKSLAISPSRKAYVQQRIDQLIKDHYVRVDSVRNEASVEETAFLMNPLLLLIYVSVHIKHYAASPAKLMSVFSLSSQQLQEHLHQLAKMQMIELTANGKSVSKVKQNSIHFSKDHPLMRGHQQILRHLCAAHIARLSDSDKVSFMATFSASTSAFEKIKEDYYKFIAQVQKHAGEGEGERVYQIGFDLFPWD